MAGKMNLHIQNQLRDMVFIGFFVSLGLILIETDKKKLKESIKNKK